MVAVTGAGGDSVGACVPLLHYAVHEHGVDGVGAWGVVCDFYPDYAEVGEGEVAGLLGAGDIRCL